MDELHVRLAELCRRNRLTIDTTTAYQCLRNLGAAVFDEASLQQRGPARWKPAES